MNQIHTPTENTVGQRLADFQTLTEALEYAADGNTGYNFYDARGRLTRALPYRELRVLAREHAARLLGFGLQRGTHVAIIADTSPEFIILFFACRYAGLVPFAMPVPVNIGSHDVYVQQIRGLLRGGKAAVAFAPPELAGFLHEAAAGLDLTWCGSSEEFAALPGPAAALPPASPLEPAYLQFTSGSTRFPQGVVISEAAVMANLKGIVRIGLGVLPGDRSASWLPFYHDMGLVGFVLGPLVSQLSVDYLRTRDFAVRPVQWLRLISRNRCSIAFSPPFGYELCARRIRSADLEDLDLSNWRAAGVGAEMIKPGILQNFAAKVATTGFSDRAFLPCYGLAEASLAVSFSPLTQGLNVMHIDAREMAERGVAVRVRTASRKVNEVVNCGRALPGHEICIVDDQGNVLPDLRVGRVLMRGPSLMDGYLDNREATAEVLSEDGWLDTGDLGYLCADDLYLTGRRKDIIIVNGRNIRAQDLEELAEQQDEVRMGDASAFSVMDALQQQTVVLVIECRSTDVTTRQDLIARLQRLVYQGFGVRCFVELVPPHTLPRTSSGKLSRAAAREGFLTRTNWENTALYQAESG